MFEFLKQAWSLINNEKGQFEFLLPIAGQLISGLFGSHAAAPAAQAQQGVTQTQSDLLNALLGQYRDVYQPMETELAQRQRTFAQGLPYEQVMQRVIGNLMQPYRVPDPSVSRALMGVQQQTDVAREQEQRQLTRRGITGPAAESILKDIGEQGLRGKYGVLSNLMVHEAEGQQQQDLRAYDVMNQLMGRAFSVAGAGREMMPGMMSGLSHLGQMYGQAGAAAAAPWQQMGAGIPGAWGAYQQQQMMSPYYQAMTNYYNQMMSPQAPGGAPPMGLPSPDMGGGGAPALPPPYGPF